MTRASEVLSWIDDARNGGQPIELLINPKLLSLKIWQNIANSSLILPQRQPPISRIHIVLSVDPSTTKDNTDLINPFAERLLNTHSTDLLSSMTLVDNCQTFVQCSARNNMGLRDCVHDGTAPSQKTVALTYGRQVGVKERPPTNVISCTTALADQDLTDVLVGGNVGIKVAFQKVDWKRAMAALNAVIQTQCGKARIALFPADSHRPLQGFLEYRLTITELYSNPADEDDAEEEAELLAKSIARRLSSTEYTGLFFAMTNREFTGQGKETVNVLLGNAVKIDPGLAAHLSRESCAYPVGHQTLRVALKEEMVAPARATRKLERVCKNFNKRSLRAGKTSDRRAAGLVMALFPIPEADGQILWLEQAPSSRRRGWGVVPNNGVVNDEVEHGAALVGIPPHIPQAAINVILDRLGVDPFTKGTATWASFPVKDTALVEKGITLAFSNRTSQENFLTRAPLIHGSIFAAPRALHSGVCRLHGPALPPVGAQATQQRQDCTAEKVLGAITVPFDTRP